MPATATKRKPRKKRTAAGYQRERLRKRQYAARRSHIGRDIGKLPPVADPARKRACRWDFRAFCETYFPEVFCLEWSEGHIEAIERIEAAVLDGGLFALAMPRASGKTCLCEAAVLWAVLYGHHRYVVIIASDKDAAAELLKSIKNELEGNDTLAADFPEVCYPIREIDGIAHRCKGQLYQGQRTRIGWKTQECILPTIPGSPASGALVQVRGITGRIRGMKNGTDRPSLVIVDDPQTDGSAVSPAQCTRRERTLAGAVLGLAGPGKKIAGLMPCTVIARDDMADRILNPSIHPEWHGLRTKLLYGFPTRQDLWEKYAELRAEGLRAGVGLKRATAFYRRNRREMDRGAKPAWPARFNDDELSAVQYAMNLYLQDRHAFAAEYQNDPLQDEAAEGLMSAEEIAAKQLNYRRREIPTNCTHLTAYIDVHDALLCYVVRAWEPDFTGYVVDYGAEPDQKKAYYLLRTAKPTLADAAPKGSKAAAAAIYAGLERLVDRLLATPWRRRDGAGLQIGRLLIDSGYQAKTINRFCRDRRSAIIMPSKGLPLGPAQKPFSEYERRPGELYGDHWRIVTPRGRGELRHMQIDVNHWKSQAHAAFMTPAGEPGASFLWKSDKHQLFGDHYRAESPTRTEGRGRVVDVWQLPPSKPDNHLFDCDVGARAAASTLGVALPSDRLPQKPQRQRRRQAVKYL